MKKQTVIATSLYLLSLLFLGDIFILLHQNGLNPFLLFTFLLPLSFAVGYTLNSYILSEKFQVDKNLLHLTKEILHELNIPLSTIQANATLLKRTLKDNEKGMKRLERIEQSSKRLERLYQELVYSIKKEIHTIEKETVELDKLIAERVSIFKRMKRNPFQLSLPPCTIYVDKIGFEKMLDNLITNAMKYSNKDKPIRIQLKENSLSIKDNGIGMDEFELLKIYDRYYQSNNHAEGEGIGLSLVKAYCDDEKIKIRIESQKGIGTEVKFNLTHVKI